MSCSSPIIAQARTWIDTPFHHQGRRKHIGCDCLGLIIGVITELQLTDKAGNPLHLYDDITYSKTPNSTYLLSLLDHLLEPVTAIIDGSLGVFTLQDNAQHLAFLSCHHDTHSMIHSDARIGRVVENRLDGFWSQRLLKIYQWPRSF